MGATEVERSVHRCLLPRADRPSTAVHLVARLHVDLLRLAGALCRR